nr:hypothetical protein [Tanacetum cinerariifolium]
MIPFCEYDTILVEINVPYHDHMREMKLDLRDGHSIQARMCIKKSHSCRNYFIMENVESSCVKGSRISIPLHAFSRFVCCTSPQELLQLAMEVTEDDGHLARSPLKNKAREMEAHRFLQLKFDGMIENHTAALEPLPPPLSPQSAKLMIMALEEYGYQSRKGIWVPKKWRSSYSGDDI